MADTIRWFFTRNVPTNLCFVAYDSSDHITPKTGLSSFTVKWTYGGGGALLAAPGATITEIGEGIYWFSGVTIPDSTNDQSLMFKISATGMDPIFISGWVSAFNPGDPVRLGMSALPNALSGTSGGLLISGAAQHAIQTNGSGYVGTYVNTDKLDYALSTASVNTVRDAIWNAVVATYVTAGTIGKKFSDMLTDVWTANVGGSYGSGTAGRILGLNLDVAVSTRSDLDAADVATSVLAALDDPNIELASVPTTTSGLRAMLKFLFAYFRNKRSATGSVETLYKEDAATPLGTASITDASGTVTKGEMS